MSSRTLKTHILPGLITGSRNSLKLDQARVATPQQALALTAQALRFDRPAVPAAFQVEEAIADVRAITPEAARRPLIRLLNQKASGLAPNAFADAIARVMSARRLRLHPFDLSKLEAFVRAHAGQLGAEASAFVQRQSPPEERRGYFETEALDDESWILAPPAARQTYIAGHRCQDAGAARALVEAVWASEPADLRVRLLGTFQEGLSAYDVPFLTSLNKDRAPRVRELAQRLLARLPGYEGGNPALRAVMERIKPRQTGFLTKRTLLSLELPATVQPGAAGMWVIEAFNGLGLDELVHALSVPVNSLPSAAEKDANLLLALVVMATHDKRFDVLSEAVDFLPDAWEQLLRAGFSELEDYVTAERAQWAQIVVRPQTWVQDTTLWSLLKLPAVLDGPAPEVLMSSLLKARPWVALLKDATKLPDVLIGIMAVLCPTSQRNALRTQLIPLDPAKTADAFLFLDIMDALEATNV